MGRRRGRRWPKASLVTRGRVAEASGWGRGGGVHVPGRLTDVIDGFLCYHLRVREMNEGERLRVKASVQLDVEVGGPVQNEKANELRDAK